MIGRHLGRVGVSDLDGILTGPPDKKRVLAPPGMVQLVAGIAHTPIEPRGRVATHTGHPCRCPQ